MNEKPPYHSKLRKDQAADTRRRILEGVTAILERGEEPTYTLVAREVGCQVRTVFRHFPTKEQLASAFWESQQGGITSRERSADNLHDLCTQIAPAFQAFERQPELVRTMLHTEHGRVARLSAHKERRKATLRCVDQALPGLDPKTREQVAAATHLLFSAAAWEMLRDYWGMRGAEAANTVQLAMSALYEGMKRRSHSDPPHRPVRRPPTR